MDDPCDEVPITLVISIRLHMRTGEIEAWIVAEGNSRNSVRARFRSLRVGSFR